MMVQDFKEGVLYTMSKDNGIVIIKLEQSTKILVYIWGFITWIFPENFGIYVILTLGLILFVFLNIKNMFK